MTVQRTKHYQKDKQKKVEERGWRWEIAKNKRYEKCTKQNQLAKRLNATK